MSEHLCLVCPVLYPEGAGRFYERPYVCDGCRNRLRQLLAELVDVYAQLCADPTVNAGQWIDEYGWFHTDPIAHHLPAGPTPSAGGDRISGTKLSYLPPNIDLSIDIPAKLDSWARDWQTYAWALLPAATVTSLSQWLTLRLEWACDSHPAVDDFADELKDMVGCARSGAGLTRSRPELIYVPCRECDQMSLYRHPGDDAVRCADEDCRLILMPDEYDRWVKLLSYSVHKVA